MTTKNRIAVLLGILTNGILFSEPPPSEVRNAPDSVKHVTVYKEPGHFGGMPANNGIWAWGNEILVGFKRATYKANTTTHSIDRDQPEPVGLARSRDGGETWKIEDPANFIDDGSKPVPSPGGIDFNDPDLAIRVRYKVFVVSHDRGRTWKGPYLFNGIPQEVTSRTDYLVSGPKEALFFMSGTQQDVNAGSYKDRAFCAQTKDGGKTFHFVSWMTDEPLTTRSVMPSTVRVSRNELVSALRRRDDSNGKKRTWIDVYLSTDNGTHWSFRSKVADTGQPEDPRNGNPPAMVRLPNGRLVVAYGYRFPRYRMCAKVSEDNGRTWSAELVLRDDARTWDFGYPRMVVRPDGKLVTVYYYNTLQNPEQHIIATIWDPDKIATQNVANPRHDERTR
jgi:hypothetical protein